MEDYLTNDAAILIINEMDYDDTRQWCQTNHQFREKCNLKYWSNQMNIDFNLTFEQGNDLMSYKPVDVTLAVYYKWLKTWFDKMSRNNFKEAAGQGLLPVIKLYHYTGLLPVIKLYHYAVLKSDKFETFANFVKVAKNGHLETLKWLYSLGGFIGIAVAFREAIRAGQLDVAKWLYSLGGVDVHAYNDSVFKIATEKGYLDMAQWIYSLGGVDAQAITDALHKARSKEIVQWLSDLPINK